MEVKDHNTALVYIQEMLFADDVLKLDGHLDLMDQTVQVSPFANFYTQEIASEADETSEEHYVLQSTSTVIVERKINETTSYILQQFHEPTTVKSAFAAMEVDLESTNPKLVENVLLQIYEALKSHILIIQN
jgi:hypothetical protein